ncbi:MAG: chemotaxis response regulator protein-glutamate methylesterase [Pseudomonadales bacterium]|nr:chemotaxis response regulator protein-glutamate methylesterase [Pseudomonadales bacterium]NRA16547.1 chemotaxis response regulator protein-glutamate methylesterase [Oceanospirillaceae bacterium]
MDKIRVLIIDDSAVIRDVLSEILAADNAFIVVGTAVDPIDARAKIKQLKPDVLTLDIEMPKMDGISFLRNLMKLNPLPVVMISTLTHAGAEETLKALEIGAVDFMAKPKVTASDSSLLHFQHELVNKVKAAAMSQHNLKFKKVIKNTLPAGHSNRRIPDSKLFGYNIIAIGASTGGTEAIRDVLRDLPENLPPIIVTQHIPESFSARFAARLNEQSKLTVLEGKNGEILKPGHVYIAPGSHHIVVKKHGNQLKCRLDNRGPVNRHQPSVEVMFNSLLKIDPTQVVAIMLTGMGDDGAKSMRKLLDAGAHTIVQDEASSLVWGMPKAAVNQGAATVVVDLHKIAPKLMQHLASAS